MSNYRRAKSAGATYFFTVITFRRRKILTDNNSRICLRNAVLTTRKHYPFSIDAWVLLPDHLHCIWTLPEGDNDFSLRWNSIKRQFSMDAKSALHKPEWMNVSKQKHRESTIWQRRFWEHQIRNDEDFEKHVDYIHYNPVKHSLVQAVADWPYSTFHSYVKAGIYPQNWGKVSDNNDAMRFGG